MPHSGEARAVDVNPPKLRSIVHRQRVRLSLGSAQLTLESKSTIPFEASGEASVNLARNFATHIHAWGPLLLQMGHKGFGRALAEINQRGFVQAVSPWARQRISGLRLGHHALMAAGLVIETWQMACAIKRSVAQRSARPATAQAARSLTTWGAVWAGVELFGTGGALLGIELGPAVVATTAIGATVGGCVGFFAGDWVARQIEEASA